jgi:DNA-binding GntR family transcriptional regulator
VATGAGEHQEIESTITAGDADEAAGLTRRHALLAVA